MDNVQNILQQYYDAFISQPRDWDFFVGMVHYIEFADKIPQTQKILLQLKAQKRKDSKTLNSIREKINPTIKRRLS